MIISEVQIHTLTADHLDGALALSTLMGWNQRLEDWCRLIELAPSGSFVALDGGRVIATAIGIDYGHCGWIAMMLVAPEHRGRGLGARLLESAIAAIPPDLPIRLDATPLGRPLYERHGFALETSLTRYVRTHPRGRPIRDQGAIWRQEHRRPVTGAAPAIATEVSPLLPADISEVARIDEGIFGGVRARLLERIHGAGPEYAWRAAGAPVQYCLGRTGRLFDQIGPVVAVAAPAAIGLASAALPAAKGRPVVVDAYDQHEDFTAWLRASGFAAQRPLYRMQRPGRAPAAPPNARALIEFAILGPEFG
jgi:GNAT superfamily N-acetyltransferase